MTSEEFLNQLLTLTLLFFTLVFVVSFRPLYALAQKASSVSHFALKPKESALTSMPFITDKDEWNRRVREVFEEAKTLPPHTKYRVDCFHEKTFPEKPQPVNLKLFEFSVGFETMGDGYSWEVKTVTKAIFREVYYYESSFK